MVFHDDIIARHILSDSVLTLALPSAALRIEGLASGLLRSSWTAERFPGPVAQGELAREEWGWKTEAVNFFDSAGDPDQLEVRVDLTMSAYAESRMDDRFELLKTALGALGIPHDLKFFRASVDETQLVHGRLGLEPMGVCEEAPPRREASWEEMKSALAQAASLDEAREWIEAASAAPAPLTAHAHAFEALLSLPGRAEFLSASMDWILWSQASGPATPADLEAAKAREAALFAQESPLERLTRCRVHLSDKRLLDLARLAAHDPEPCARLASNLFEALAPSRCVFADGQAWQQESLAKVAGELFDERPELVGSLSSRAREFLSLPLTPALGATPQRADLEASWLRLQTVLGAQDTSPSRSGPRL